MGLYLKKAIFVNRAPFEHLELNFKEKGINVLSAINGKGKTTILSHITDAFYELAKKAYRNEFEGKENKYYRISSPLYNINFATPSFVYLRYDLDGRNIDYVDIRNKCTKEQYDSVVDLESKIPFENFKSSLESSNNVKYWSLIDGNEIQKKIFNKSIVTYFPSYRYETPSYLNDPYDIKLDYAIESRFSGTLDNPIEVVSDIHSLVNWFLDVLLDMKLNEETRLFRNEGAIIPVTIPAKEKAFVWDHLNTIVSSSLSSKHYKGTIRLGIGSRNSGGTRVVIMNDVDEKHIVICPSIFNLSAGELSLISIFGEILHQADNIHNNIELKEISGIVLIDEVDKHLHITLQKEVLPKLFNLFPNVQFVVSSHSPFLNMGLADEALDRTQIIDLDNNGVVCEPTNNELYKEVYDMMVNENQRFADKYRTLEGKIKAVNKPVIITEGKTDWKHLKAALSFFKENGIYEDLEVEILEYDFDFGDSKLHSLLNQYKLFPHKYIVIGVFDCDEANGRNIHTAGGIKKYGENIWGISIPIPDFRSYNTSGISIEFLYKDIDLKKEDANGRRIYITSEFNENGRLTSNVKIGVKNHHDVKSYITREKEKVQADEVIDIEGNSLALSKEDFASNILAKDGVFATVCFDAFKPIFDKIKDVLDRKIH